MISFGKINFNYPIVKVKNEVIKLLNQEWHNHFNSAHYTGKWEVFSLVQNKNRFNSILAESLEADKYVEQKLIDDIPYLKNLIDALKCDKKSIRLLNLKVGAIIKPHKDAELSYEEGEVRLHFPICTNSDVNFILDGQRLDMLEGECWYINANLIHQVSNSGISDRIHLVIDCVVNEWITNLFNCSELTYKVTSVDTNLQKSIIAELRLQNTIGAQQLADKLENDINAR